MYLKILEIDYFKKLNFYYQVLKKIILMNFYFWKKNDVLKVNKYGILEPKNLKAIPNIF